MSNDRPGIQDALYSLVDPALLPIRRWRGGTVYFPPGTYRIRPLNDGRRRPQEFAGFNEDLYVPPDVQLMFAPGASLLFELGPGQLDLDGGGVLTAVEFKQPIINIAGEINSGPQKIFETSETVSTALTATPFPQVTNVLLTSEKIVEVFPEWWGTGSEPQGPRTLPNEARILYKSFIDTVALQAALDAACNHRLWSPN